MRNMTLLVPFCAAVSALAACSGGAGNNTSAVAGNNVSAPAPAGGSAAAPLGRVTPAILAGTSWRKTRGSCEGYDTLEFRADTIVTPSRTIQVTYEAPNGNGLLPAVTVGGTSERILFGDSDANLVMMLSSGPTCTYQRAN